MKYYPDPQRGLYRIIACSGLLGLFLATAGCGGTEADYQADSLLNAEPSAALGIGSPTGPFLEADRIIGIGMTGEASHVVTFDAQGRVSQGIASNLAWKQGPKAFRIPTNYRSSDIVSMAITNNNQVYTWYKNHRRSKGTIERLDAYFGPAGRTYSIPNAPDGRARSPSDIAGIAFLPTNNYVYAWYKDGYVSVGSTGDLGKHTGPGKYWSAQKPYNLPPGKTTADIVDMEMKRSNSRVYTWYRDGTYSIGKSWDLGRDLHSKLYTRHGILKSTYPSSLPTLGSTPSPSPSYLRDMDINSASKAASLAVGRTNFAVGFEGYVSFYNRSGTSLSYPVNYNLLFANLLRGQSYGSTLRRSDVNHYLKFPNDCESYPSTDGHHYCVSDVLPKAQVLYDKQASRFVIVAQAKNALWTNRRGGASHVSLVPYNSVNDAVEQNGVLRVTSASHGYLARRVTLIAVSRSENPRDGFYTYAFAQDNYRQGIKADINGDHLLITQGQKDIHADLTTPRASLVSLDDMRRGRLRPAYIHYYRHHLDNISEIAPIEVHDSPSRHSLLIGLTQNNSWKVFSLRLPAYPYMFTDPVGETIYTDERDLEGFVDGHAVFRNNMFHFVANRHRTTQDNIDYFETYYRGLAGIIQLDGGIVFLPHSPNNRYYEWSDNHAGMEITKETPLLQVNDRGDVLIAYGESGKLDNGNNARASIRRVLWRYNRTLPDPAQIWRLGATSSYDPRPTHMQRVFVANASVDPINDRVFWGSHRFRSSGSNWQAFIGTVSP